MLTRICTARDCRKVKPLSEFPKSKTTLGVGNRCKECDKEFSKQQYYKRREKILVNKNEYYYENYKKIRARQNARSKIMWKIDYEKNRGKVKAREKLNYYVDKGYILRPKKCMKCKKSGKIEAHHKDYSKPLEVDWLCKQCHEKVHYKFYSLISKQ